MDSFIYTLPKILPVAEEPQKIGEMSVPVCVNPTAPPVGTQLSCTTHQTSSEKSYISTNSSFSLLYFPTDGKYEGCYGPAYVRKRNERERRRVKCINEGYTKLRRLLPQEYMERRLSKLQTLRAAICYIQHLQEVLSQEGVDSRVVTQEHRNGRCMSSGQKKRSSQV